MVTSAPTMNLSDFLKNDEGRVDPAGSLLAKLAKKAGTSPGYLYLIALGHKRAGPELARKIETASEGKVTKESLRPDIWGDEQKAA